MIELVEYLVSSLVPDGDYTVEQRDANNANDIVITIAKKDIGKIIGKQGRIAKAIRTLVKSASSKSNVRYNVVIEEKMKSELTIGKVLKPRGLKGEIKIEIYSSDSARFSRLKKSKSTRLNTTSNTSRPKGTWDISRFWA